MPSPHETTALLHPDREEEDHVIGDTPYPAKILTPDNNVTDSEANRGIPEAGEAAKISTWSFIKPRASTDSAEGLFTSNLDSSLVLATHPRIASEFDALDDSSWIFASFLLGGVVTQMLYAKLSDVYGRRVMLVFCYGLFGTGCGVSQSMGAVILGRVISGSGSGGMWGLVQVIVTDLVPLREAAPWLGYINIVSATGRSIGGPLGGFLADLVGWRWSFLGQTPLFFLAMIVSVMVVPNKKAPGSDRGSAGLLSRIDFTGSLLLGASILFLIFPIEIGGVKVPWTHPAIFGLLAAGAVLLVLFVLNEARWASKPAFPIYLMKHRDILASYAALTCIVGSQTSLMYFVPIYFQVTTEESNTLVGLHLVPAVIGNGIGGLVSGHFIKRQAKESTGGYKAVILGASVIGSIGYALLIARWTGNTNTWESLYIALGGFGSGMSSSAVFVSLNAVAEPAHKAVVTSLLQLTMPIGMLLGVAAGSAVMVGVLKKILAAKLLEIGLGDEIRGEIIQKAIANVDYIRELPEFIGDIVVGGYVTSLRASFVIILSLSLLGLAAGCLIRERRL
ncbi:major facilitator superfamily transporter [Xylaria intraflava]|nr:major facilitator superfamily transporter [Xylaria intraflava]